jgi:hypothetical protein
MKSENIFEGDTGNTVYGPPSRRIGLEFTNHYRPLSWISFEGDVTMTRARFLGFDTDQYLLYQQLLQPGAFQWGQWLGNAPGNYAINSAPIIAMSTLELGEATGLFGGSSANRGWVFQESSYWHRQCASWLSLEGRLEASTRCVQRL